MISPRLAIATCPHQTNLTKLSWLILLVRGSDPPPQRPYPSRPLKDYCVDRYGAKRRPTRTVTCGPLKFGSDHPLVRQTMATTDTRDVEATINQVRQGRQSERASREEAAAGRSLARIKNEYSTRCIRSCLALAAAAGRESFGYPTLAHCECACVFSRHFLKKSWVLVICFAWCACTRCGVCACSFLLACARSQDHPVRGRRLRLGADHGARHEGS